MRFALLKDVLVGGARIGAVIRFYIFQKFSIKRAEITLIKLADTTVRFALLKTLRSRGLELAL